MKGMRREKEGGERNRTLLATYPQEMTLPVHYLLIIPRIFHYFTHYIFHLPSLSPKLASPPSWECL